MDQREQPQPGALGAHQLGQRAHGEPVDDHARARGQARQRAGQAAPRAAVARGKLARELVHRDLPAAAAQAVDDARVVDVAARPLVERTGHEKMEVGGAHTGPS